MQIVLPLCTLRPFRDGDQSDIVRHANNPRVAKHLRDRFPQPYTWADADAWIPFVTKQSPPRNFAICVEDHVVGSIGLMPGDDIHRISAEVGYWLGESFWGRGLAACALQGLTRYAFDTFAELNRLFAYVDDDHLSSIRVLEKSYFRREGHLVGAAIKHGHVHNQFLYAITRSEARPAMVP
jgi:[ribosomal protein S5]-alanine N-acetyltransferase